MLQRKGQARWSNFLLLKCSTLLTPQEPPPVPGDGSSPRSVVHMFHGQYVQSGAGHPPIRHRVEQNGGLVGNRTIVHFLVRPSVCCTGRDTQDEARRGRKSTLTTRASVVRVPVCVLHSGRAVLLLKVL